MLCAASPTVITTASIYDNELPAGFRILVMRRWPRGVPRADIDLWLKDLGPSNDLLDDYREGRCSWSEFATKYRRGLKKQRDMLRQVKNLEREHGVIVLLCWERDDRCHRFILKEVLDAMVTE